MTGRRAIQPRVRYVLLAAFAVGVVCAFFVVLVLMILEEDGSSVEAVAAAWQAHRSTDPQGRASLCR
jgi:hypothetical protein